MKRIKLIKHLNTLMQNKKSNIRFKKGFADATIDIDLPDIF